MACRVLLYPTSLLDMEVRGDAMWCSSCHVPVKWQEKSFAASHLKSATHKENAKKKPMYVEKPGPSVAAPTPEPIVHTPPAKKQRIADLKEVLNGMNEKQKITNDFVAAFLQAGIPLNKLDHPARHHLDPKPELFWQSRITTNCHE